MSYFTRRQFLEHSALLIGGTRLLRGADSPACALTTEQEEGPYYVDYNKIRQNITEGRPGVPIRLQVQLVHAKTCAPLPAAALDIWHCDAEGIYSGFTANKGGFGPPPPGLPRPGGPPPGGRPHGAQDKTRFLRGLQLTNTVGQAEFATIYPGWYEGRAIHIHVKVHTGGHVSHTGQFFFPEELTERIAKLQPYAKHTSVHRTTLDEDHVFGEEHGVAGMLTMERIQKGSDEGGFIAKIAVAVDPEATPEPVGMRGGPGGPRPNGPR